MYYFWLLFLITDLCLLFQELILVTEQCVWKSQVLLILGILNRQILFYSFFQSKNKLASSSPFLNVTFSYLHILLSKLYLPLSQCTQLYICLYLPQRLGLRKMLFYLLSHVRTTTNAYALIHLKDSSVSTHHDYTPLPWEYTHIYIIKGMAGALITMCTNPGS